MRISFALSSSEVTVFDIAITVVYQGIQGHASTRLTSTYML